MQRAIELLERELKQARALFDTAGVGEITVRHFEMVVGWAIDRLKAAPVIQGEWLPVGEETLWPKGTLPATPEEIGIIPEQEWEKRAEDAERGSCASVSQHVADVATAKQRQHDNEEMKRKAQAYQQQVVNDMAQYGHQPIRTVGLCVPVSAEATSKEAEFGFYSAPPPAQGVNPMPSEYWNQYRQGTNALTSEPILDMTSQARAKRPWPLKDGPEWIEWVEADRVRTGNGNTPPVDRLRTVEIKRAGMLAAVRTKATDVHWGICGDAAWDIVAYRLV